MGKYLDLHIHPPAEDRRSCERMAEVLSIVHYAAVGISVPTGLFHNRIEPLRRVFEQYGVSTVLRVDLSLTSRTELLRALRKFRNLYDIVAVKCLNQRVANVACRDRRVDVIYFDVANRNLRFTHSFARLLRGAIEFNLVSDVVERADSWTFSQLRRAMGIAREHRVKVVLSSGATSYEMIRSPLEISALATALGLTEEESIRGVSSAPSSIVDENRKKRAPEYVEEGVKIVVPSGP